jgi:lysozyme
VGREQLKTSTLLRKLNAGDRTGVAPCLRAWVFVNGKVALGLVRRRAAESALWSMP